MLTPWAFCTWNIRSQACPNTSLHWLHFKWTFLPWDVSSWKPATNNEDKYIYFSLSAVSFTFIWFIKSKILRNFLQHLNDKTSQSQRREGKVSAFIDLSFIPNKIVAVGRIVMPEMVYMFCQSPWCQSKRKEKTFFVTSSGSILLFVKYQRELKKKFHL